MKRLLRISYLVVVCAVTACLVVFTAFSLIEALGPNDEATGRLLDRVEAERVVTCTRNRALTCQPGVYPIYTVIGERDDGTTWLVVGEGPFDATRGETGAVSVTTSTITGRVIGLGGEDDEWTQPSALFAVAAAAALIAWGCLVWAYEARRRDGRWTMGRFAGTDLLAGLPGVIVGAFAAVFVFMGPGWRLDVVTSAEAQSGFLADPFDYALVQEEATERGGGVVVNEPFRAASVDMAVVGRDHLTDDVLAGWEQASNEGVLAIPLLRIGQPKGPLSTVEFFVVTPTDQIESVRCPDSILAFPTSIGQGDSFGGFVCFGSEAEGGEFGVYVGSNQFTERVARPAYELVDGTIVIPSA